MTPEMPPEQVPVRPQSPLSVWLASPTHVQTLLIATIVSFLGVFWRVWVLRWIWAHLLTTYLGPPWSARALVGALVCLVVIRNAGRQDMRWTNQQALSHMISTLYSGLVPLVIAWLATQ